MSLCEFTVAMELSGNSIYTGKRIEGMMLLLGARY